MVPSVVAAEKLGATSPKRNAIQCLSLIDLISEDFTDLPSFRAASQGEVPVRTSSDPSMLTSPNRQGVCNGNPAICRRWTEHPEWFH
jgi:hypothetical protein